MLPGHIGARLESEWVISPYPDEGGAGKMEFGVDGSGYRKCRREKAPQGASRRFGGCRGQDRCDTTVHCFPKPYNVLDNLTSLGGVPREQKMRKGHLPRVIFHQVY